MSSTDLTTTLSEQLENYYYAISAGDGEGEGEELHDYYGFQGPIKYRTEDFISRPSFSPGCDIEENILEFDFSYGYDCKKPYNLVVIDENTIIFASGNLIHFFDVTTLELWFRRSAKGGGIGHITNNPVHPHFAVGENGKNPPIIIYEWPSLEIVCVLKGGTGSSYLYTHLNYSPEGHLLVSQGGDPDYMITVWDWSKATILLRTRSYMNDVLRVMFSPYVPGHLTSSGVAHIKFWKIAKTFTGLKLQGNLGRFGKTEYSDIVGIYPMADEKVISGCYWGNILVWEEGLIKLEVCRKNRKRCHDDAIVQFNYHHGELWTVSLDGHVKMWFYDTIDQADPPDEDRFCMMEPTYDFHTPGARFMCITKQFKDPENTFYFAQDAKGAIWRIDLNIEEEAAPSERLHKSHAGITKGLAVCPWGPFFTTIGIGGWVHLYNYLTRKLLMIILFPAPGAQIMWMPMKFDPSGEIAIAVFGDGTVRVGVWKIDQLNPSNCTISIIQILKVHSKAITVMSLNHTGNLFVTGAEDNRIFVLEMVYEELRYPKLIPIGYLNIQSTPTCFTWHNDAPNTLIVGCLHGEVFIVELPTSPVPYTKISFELVLAPISQRFATYKSQIYRDVLLEEIRVLKEAKREKKMEDLKRIRDDNPGLDIDEELFLQDSESEEELPELFIPEVPNKIHWIQHTPDDTLWLSMAGYDAGYIYEYKLGQSDPVPFKFTPIPGAESNDVANYVYSEDKEYLFFAMMDGSIRVNRVNRDDWHDLSNYWSLTMHDNFNGYIPGFSFSYDNEYFLTSGNDGNVFVFKFNTDQPKAKVEIPARVIPDLGMYKLYDNVNCNNIPSLEETIVNIEADRLNKVANENKQAYQEKIFRLRELYEELLEANETLPPSQKLTVEELIVDHRVEDNLEKMLADEEALVRRKFEFNLEKSRVRMQKLRKHFIDSMDMYPIKVMSIRTNLRIKTIKQRCLGEDFYELLETVEKKMLEAELKGRQAPRQMATALRAQTPPKVEQNLEYFLIGLSPEIIEHKLGAKINRILRKYRARKEWKDNRKREWAIYNAQMPTEITGDEDEGIIEQAEEEIGDYKLKSAPDYKAPKLFRETTYKKYKQLLLVRERSYNLIHDMNLKIYEMRNEKRLLHDKLLNYSERLKAAQDELLEVDQNKPPEIFEINEEEYPEKFLEIHVEIKDIKPKEETKTKLIVPLSEDQLQRSILLETNPDAVENDTVTDWEFHFRKVRYRLKRYEQDRIIRRMKTAIDHFDVIHNRVRNEIMDVRVESNMMHLHLLVLHQELLILKDCEEKENQLSDNVNVKHTEYLDVLDENTELIASIESLKKGMEKLQEHEKEINKNFYSWVSDSKFYDFLRRIFKKKYKPPKVPGPDDETDSSSSSSSSDDESEEDAASVDSKDFGIVRLDESICPKGCEPAIYEMTFKLRTQRHDIEQQYRDCTSQIEAKGKQKDVLAKRMRIIDAELKKRREELTIFQREKQKRLNQIICTVILKLSQMQHIKPEGGLNNVKNTLVFSQNTLSGLYQRVGVLERERQEQTDKHTLSLLHLKRMESDFKVMGLNMKNLRTEIVKEMHIKFGSVVDIKELEEYLLKRMIFDLRLSISDVKGMFDAQMEHLYEMYKQYQKSMMKWLKMNTSAQDLLCLLGAEKVQLGKTYKHQQKVLANMQHLYETANQVKMELMKLDKVIKSQNVEIELLKREIKTYKTKGFVLPPVVQPTPIVLDEDEEVAEEQSFVSEWEELDDYMYTEAYAKEYWAHRQIQEARKTRQEVIYAIMDDLFKNINLQLQHNMVVALIKRVVSDVMNKCDVNEIMTDILNAIPHPDRLSNEQHSIIELTAEKLYTVDDIEEESVVTEDTKEQRMYREQMTEQIHNIAMKVLDETQGDPTQIVMKLVETILDNVPLHIVLEDQHMQLILDKMTAVTPEIDKDTLDNVTLKSLEASILMEEFLSRVLKDVQAIGDDEPVD